MSRSLLRRTLRGVRVGVVLAAALASHHALAQAPTPTITVEAENPDVYGKEARVYRDARASGGQAAVLRFGNKTGGSLISGTSPVLPPGDYVATFYLEVLPVEVLHGLDVTLRADNGSFNLQSFNVSAGGGYQPYEVRFTHGGGPVKLSAGGRASSGYDGMRLEASESEKAESGNIEADQKLLNVEIGKSDQLTTDNSTMLGGGDAMQLEEASEITTLTLVDWRLVCDKVEIRASRLAPALVRDVEVDKIHYKPGERVTASAQLVATPGGDGEYDVVATDVTELDTARPVYTGKVTLKVGEPTALTFDYAMPGPEFGHELRIALQRDGKTVHDAGALFGVSRNVYRVGITGRAGSHDRRFYNGKKDMEQNKANYANYFEIFAWAECDYSELTPDTELFFSGQTQYPGSITGYHSMLDEAHKLGIKGITYGKACAAGIAGYRDFQRHPEFYSHSPWGPVAEAYNTFYLERMVDNDYGFLKAPADGGWQHWASLWTKSSYTPTVEHGAQAIIDSVEMFGWDGIRWDGHFVGNQKPFIDMLNAKYPDFVHGYNIAFANPGADRFMPPGDSLEDFKEVAKNHGLMMDESARDWSNSGFSLGWTEPFYKAMARESDYEKRIGGLPLFIVFDMASPQDTWLNVISGLAAGERYTYITSPGSSTYGTIPKFLTRYSAYVWDDTARLQTPADAVRVVVPPSTPASIGKAPVPDPWWQETTWLRQLPDGRQQLLVNLVNPPNYKQFNTRVQVPPLTRTNVQVAVKLPPGTRLARAAHVSPDLLDGAVELQATADGEWQTVTLPELKLWSIVAFDLAPAADGGTLAWPAFPLTDPVGEADAILANADAAKAAAAEAKAQKAESKIGPSEVKKEAFYADYANRYNIDDGMDKKTDKPAATVAIARNGRYDVLHAKGAFGWLTPMEGAVALAGGGSYDQAYVDYVGFMTRYNKDGGFMDDYPDSWEAMFKYDTIVLDNIHIVAMGAKRRVMLAEYVRRGGGLVVLGGFFNLSLGADHNTYMEELLPLDFRKYHDIVRDDSGAMVLKPERPDVFGKLVDWSDAPSAFVVDTTPVRAGAEVLVRAGDHPAIVAGKYGAGRVVVVMVNPHGDYAPTARPYWLWKGWSGVLAGCLQWVAPDAGKVIVQKRVERALDPKYPMPDDLMLESITLDAAELTKQLKGARHNMVDAESARTVMQIAMDNREKINDLELLQQIASAAGPYLDKSFAPMAVGMTKANLGFIREAGYQVLGLSGDPAQRPLLEAALKTEDDATLQRAILISLAQLNDPASIPVVESYMKRKNAETFLAFGVLVRLHAPNIMARALPAYVDGVMRRIHLKSGRRSAYDDLHGGTSFKLTPAARRSAQAVLDNVILLENAAKFDVAYFNDSVDHLTDEELGALTDFLATAENRQVAPLAYRVFCRQPAERIAPYRPKLAAAKIDAIRLLAP